MPPNRLLPRRQRQLLKLRQRLQVALLNERPWSAAERRPHGSAEQRLVDVVCARAGTVRGGDVRAAGQGGVVRVARLQLLLTHHLAEVELL